MRIENDRIQSASSAAELYVLWLWMNGHKHTCIHTQTECLLCHYFSSEILLWRRSLCGFIISISTQVQPRTEKISNVTSTHTWMQFDSCLEISISPKTHYFALGWRREMETFESRRVQYGQECQKIYLEFCIMLCFGSFRILFPRRKCTLCGGASHNDILSDY